jgi:nitrile hydratase accessory protein
MAPDEPSDLLDTEGPAAPPRTNGELVFAAPWESRLFGMTMTLHRAGLFEWEEFRRLLIEEIAAWEKEGHPAEQWSYYERWGRAFERLLACKGLCAPAEIERRQAALAARREGHDH